MEQKRVAKGRKGSMEREGEKDGSQVKRRERKRETGREVRSVEEKVTDWEGKRRK